MSGVSRLVAAAALALAAVAVLDAPLRAVQREVRIERALDALVAGLAAVGSAGSGTELPVDLPVELPDELSGGELAARLVASGHLAELPINPDTGRAYGSVDLEPDLLFCSRSAAGEWLLEALSSDGGRVVAVRRVAP